MYLEKAFQISFVLAGTDLFCDYFCQASSVMATVRYLCIGKI